MMEWMIRAAVVAVVAALLASVLRQSVPQFALVLTLTAGVWLLAGAADSLGAVVELMNRLSSIAGVEPQVIQPVLKTAAIAVLARLTGELCRGAGEQGLAAFVDTAGTMAALGAALPLLEGVAELMAVMLT